MIEGKDISKRFGDQVIFDNFCFQIQNGECVCFSGPSGSGKTTLLNIIGLLEPLDSGEILINGKAYNTRKEKIKYYRDEVGFLFQNFALMENKTVYENLKIVKLQKDSPLNIENALSRVGLINKKENKVYTLSGGEQQRVALARLILKQCNIILADEPTGSLDKRNAKTVMDILMSLNTEGKTVIFVTHDEHIKKYAQRTIKLCEE